MSTLLLAATAASLTPCDECKAPTDTASGGSLDGSQLCDSCYRTRAKAMIARGVVKLAERPQLFSSELGDLIFDVRAGWRIIKNNPRGLEVMDLRASRKEINAADIDREYAMTEMEFEDLIVPVLAVPVVDDAGNPRVHVIDGWHRSWRHQEEGCETLAFYLLTDTEAQSILLTPEKAFIYSLENVSEERLRHDARRIGRKIDADPQTVYVASCLILQGAPQGAVEAFLVSRGVDPAAFVAALR